MITDSKRLQQIIKNLLSNAFKFTNYGQVTLSVNPTQSGWSADNEELSRASEVIAFSVSDTGIGIAPDKQQIVFEAFQQADGSTSRKYGGTGLGLAISRELSYLLGGEIRLISTPGRGSTFTLYLPSNYTPARSGRRTLATNEAATGTPPNRLLFSQEKALLANSAPRNGASKGSDDSSTYREQLPEPALEYMVNEVGDDRDDIRPGDLVMLIVENDLGFARFLLDTAREKGFKGLVTSLGARALTLTRDYKPHVISLDIYLPDIAGWRVLERLKNDVATRHIPVCVISTDEAAEHARSSGALAFIAKPIQSKDLLEGLFDFLSDYLERPTKSLLIVEPDENRRNHILECVVADNLQVAAVPDAGAGIRALKEQRIDCMILGGQVEELANGLSRSEFNPENSLRRVPVIVYDDEEVVHDEAAWKRLGETCSPLKRAHSPNRLLDLSSYFLHRDIARLPEAKRQVLLDLHQSDRILKGKTALIVDDDMRNIFALSSVLEEHDMIVMSADNGRDAIRLLSEERDVDIVLMDIMMPEMDGMETMRALRKIQRLKNLPIIAVTAKAMKGDREKCIEAGAWDYLSKPVDTDQMLAVLRAWLHR